MNNSYLLSFLSQRNIPTITRKRHAYLTYYGLEQQYTYILKEGVVKTSIIFKDGREFNIAYLKGPNIIAPFNVRVETEEATFYLIPRVEFWNYINNDRQLQDYVKEYYRLNLAEAIQRQQLMSMNGRTGAVCAFLYTLVHQFGKEHRNGWLIDFPVTNEDIAGFCGISTRNSVNRILHQLKEQGIIDIQNQKILVMDMVYMQQYVSE